jgi:hypothetical protein
MAASHDRHVLLTILLIHDRRGLAAGREHVAPHDLAGPDVDRFDEIVGRRRDDESRMLLTRSAPGCDAWLDSGAFYA